jgi:hypothetical protein
MPGSTEHEDEVRQLCRALAPGGMVLWRSAARVPWYNEVFARNGFIVSPLGVRTGNRKAIDRVNMFVFPTSVVLHGLTVHAQVCFVLESRQSLKLGCTSRNFLAFHT